MRKHISFVLLFFSLVSQSQVNQDEIGAWYVFSFSDNFREGPFGCQGDIQYRNWNQLGDLEQMLLRGGFCYSITKTKTKFTLGCAHITTGAYGDDNTTFSEFRIYQEILQPQTIASRIYTLHRLRSEQRFVQNNDFRTRYRYAVLMNIPFNKKTMEKDAVYLSLYDEVFINGELEIGGGKTVKWFDRNRVSAAIGYQLTGKARLQAGMLLQTTTINKFQLQYTFNYNF